MSLHNQYTRPDSCPTFNSWRAFYSRRTFDSSRTVNVRLLTPLPLLLALALLLLLPAQLLAQGPAGGPRLTLQPVLNSPTLTPGQQHALAIVVDVPKGFHAQSAKPSSEDYIPFVITLKNLPPGLTALAPEYPPGENKTYAALGTLNVYEGRVVAYIPLTVSPDLAPGTQLTLQGTVQSQLCDNDTCFPPDSAKFSLTTTVAAPTSSQPPDKETAELFRRFDWSVFGRAPAASQPTTKPAAGASSGTNGGAGTGNAADISILGLSLAHNGQLAAFVGAFIVGLIFNVMPCVLPVLPLKAVGFIQAAEKSRGKSILLGLFFSAGLISVFAGLALAIFGWGFQWGQLFQYNAFVFGMATVLTVMAASQWGLFTFRVPLGLYTIEPRHDTLSGNFMFGVLTALLSTPCTASVFPALLAWAATQPLLTGILLLMTVGLGMALPYFLLACFPNLARKVPRTGPWSEIVKQFMGFLILATAAYFVGTKLLTGNQYMYLVTPILLASCLFLIYRTARLMPRPTPIAVSLLLALLLASGSVAATRYLNRPTVEWTAYSDDALQKARASGRLVLIDFTATWCANCHYVEATVYSNDQVKQALASANALLLKVDITQPNAPGSNLLLDFNPAGGIPLTVLYPPNKEPLQLPGIYTAERLLQSLPQN